MLRLDVINTINIKGQEGRAIGRRNAVVGENVPLGKGIVEQRREHE